MVFKKVKNSMRIGLVLALVLLCIPMQAHAAKRKVYTIVIKDHKFEPEKLTVSEGEKIKLIIDNQDPTPEEFESYDLNREKIVAGNGKISVFIGPLKAGEYKYFGEFNPKTAQGIIQVINKSKKEEK